MCYNLVIFNIMFNYSIKIKILIGFILVVLIIGLWFSINTNKSRARDLYRVSQARILATSLERYFDQNYAYPDLAKIKVVAVKTITENGVNQAGDYIYFKGPVKLLDDGTLVSTASRYVIEFSLENDWNLWGLDNSGGICRLSNNLAMICRSAS